MLMLLRRLRRDRKGATAIEYGLILALICVAIMLSVLEVAKTSVNMWNNIASTVAAN
jgi:pilus assembly protein Flp/PilA